MDKTTKRKKYTVAELADIINGTIVGNSQKVVEGVATVNEAKSTDLALADKEPFYSKALKSEAACILTYPDKTSTNGITLIKVSNPQEAFVKILDLFKLDEMTHQQGISASAVVETGARISKNASIGANSYIGQNAVIGEGTIIYPNVYIGENVEIGSGCRIYPNAVIYYHCSIGNNVILHSGCVIGGDGFGFKACGNTGLIKFPHIGTVTIGDDVEIGANSAVDRAKTGATTIGKGTKIDNLVHIAHNVIVGENCIIVAQTGIAGSVEIGNGVTLAAQAGVKDHLRIGDNCVVAARAGVIGDVADNSVVSGFPARDHKYEMRIEAAKLHLPELMKRLRTLEKEVEILRGKNGAQEIDEND